MEGGESRVCRKRKEPDGADCEVLMKIPAIYDGDEDIDVDNLQIEEEMLMEAVKRLEEEISNPFSSCVTADQYHNQCQHQPQTTLPSSSLPSFVTINGNEESCGPSFSDSSSTVMASVDTRGLIGVWHSFSSGVAASDLCNEQPASGPTDEIGPLSIDSTVDEEFWPLEDPAEVMEDNLLEKLAGGEEESDDEWMARVLSCTACELELG